MPWSLQRFQQARCLHFITFSCSRRETHLGTPRSRDIFEHTLEDVRQWYGFYVAGYVVMPEQRSPSHDRTRTGQALGHAANAQAERRSAAARA